MYASKEGLTLGCFITWRGNDTQVRMSGYECAPGMVVYTKTWKECCTVHMPNQVGP